MMLSSLLLAALAAEAQPHGTYVEARTAAVYAGACHFGGQYTTQGREAVLGWHFEGGVADGVELEAVDLVVVVAGSHNLDALGQEEVQNRSVAYLDAGASAEANAAALAWVRRQHGELLGELVAVHQADVVVVGGEDTFWLTAGEDVELRGTAMPNRECCKMAYNVWYEPFHPLRGQLVGNPTVFRVQDADLDRSWSRSLENEAFFGAF